MRPIETRPSSNMLQHGLDITFMHERNGAYSFIVDGAASGLNRDDQRLDAAQI